MKEFYPTILAPLILMMPVAAERNQSAASGLSARDLQKIAPTWKQNSEISRGAVGAKF